MHLKSFISAIYKTETSIIKFFPFFQLKNRFRNNIWLKYSKLNIITLIILEKEYITNYINAIIYNYNAVKKTFKI